jgi:aldose 1-epimerase
MKLFTIKNKNGLIATISDYGGRIVNLLVPDKADHFDDIVLGFDNLNDYLTANEKYYGAIIGRYANRIKNAAFSIDNQKYLLDKNDGDNCLHGGDKGFHNILWNVNQLDDQKIELKYLFNDLNEGFPGNLDVKVIYSWSDKNELIIEYFATTDKTTVINLTHHSFFNLTGNPINTIDEHLLQIHADFFTPVNKNLIPTGELSNVAETPFDFRELTPIGKRVHTKNQQLVFGGGYDHNWVLKANSSKEKIQLAAKVIEPRSGRVMEVLTNEPGIQFYGGNFLDGNDIGKNNISYKFRTAFCLETQHFPDSPNNPDFPSTLLRKGENYHSICIYRFNHI